MVGVLLPNLDTLAQQELESFAVKNQVFLRSTDKCSPRSEREKVEVKLLKLIRNHVDCISYYPYQVPRGYYRQYVEDYIFRWVKGIVRRGPEMNVLFCEFGDR